MALKVGMVSLGCPKNLVDSEVMLGLIRDAGYEIVNREDLADVLVVNTCGFIEAAREESIDAILAMARYKDSGRCKALIVTGCLSQRYARELAYELPEVDAFVGTGEFMKIVSVIGRVLEGERVILAGEPQSLYDDTVSRMLTTPPFTAYLKIAEGCDNRCSYCVIPEIRGRYRSRPLESVQREARRLASLGVKEFILVAQDTTRYGEDIYGAPRLALLLRKLADIDGIEWIRFLYAYPTRVTPELIEVVAGNPKVCKYIDLPLQHASDKILRLMNRKGTAADVRRLVATLRERIPGVTLRSSFIVGFPGETDGDFDTLLGFLDEMQFDRIGVFKYSPEEGTRAASLPGRVPERVAEARLDEAMRLARSISRKHNEERVGKTCKVLVEGPSPESDLVTCGRSEAEAPGIDGLIYIDAGEYRPGEFREVRITQAADYDLAGEIVS